MRDTLGGAPEVDQDRSILTQMPGRFAKGDQHVLGEKIITFRFAQTGLCVRIKDNHLVLHVKLLQVLTLPRF